MKEKATPRLSGCMVKLVQVVLAILAIVPLFVAPVAHYKYKSKTYTMSGTKFLTGGTICGGTVTVSTSIVFVLLVVAMVVIILASLLAIKMKPIVCAEISAIAAIVGLMTSFRATTAMSKLLSDAKSVGSEWGVYIPLVISIILLVLQLKELSKNKVMCALDFMVLPGMIYLIINNYIPMFGIYIAFKKVDYSKGLWNSDWVGMTNFKYLFSTTDAFIITRNTLLYNAAFIVLGILTGIIVGICLAELLSPKFQKFYQTAILLPQLISMVIVSYIVYGFLSNETGLITKLMGDNAINFYATSKVWPFILIFIYIWKQIGYNAIIFLATIVGIDRSLYEAARVDGATKWQQIFKITLPQLKPTIITLFLLQVGRIFYSDFGLFYQVPLDAGALYNVTNTVDTYVYRALLVNNNISTASAASTYQAVVGFALVFAVNMIVRKVDKENAMF